jgi:acetyl-CoA carboxylase biotin carboxyl carrier protein
LAHDNLTYDDLLRIVELIKSSEQFSEFRLKIGEIEIELRRRRHPGEALAAPVEAAPQGARAAEPLEPPRADHVAGAAVTRASRVAPTWDAGSIIVRAPMVGTFYRAPEPGAPPFVEVGQLVEADTIVCIIEVMKLMNSIPAGARGVVTQVLVDDAAPVDTDAPLVVLAPAS